MAQARGFLFSLWVLLECVALCAGAAALTFDQWQCGMDETSRRMALEQMIEDCPDRIEQFNECCLAHDQCYNEQRGRNYCDDVMCKCMEAHALQSKTAESCKQNAFWACISVSVGGWASYDTAGPPKTAIDSTNVPVDKKKTNPKIIDVSTFKKADEPGSADVISDREHLPFTLSLLGIFNKSPEEKADDAKNSGSNQKAPIALESESDESSEKGIHPKLVAFDLPKKKADGQKDGGASEMSKTVVEQPQMQSVIPMELLPKISDPISEQAEDPQEKLSEPIAEQAEDPHGKLSESIAEQAEDPHGKLPEPIAEQAEDPHGKLPEPIAEQAEDPHGKLPELSEKKEETQETILEPLEKVEIPQENRLKFLKNVEELQEKSLGSMDSVEDPEGSLKKLEEFPVMGTNEETRLKEEPACEINYIDIEEHYLTAVRNCPSMKAEVKSCCNVFVVCDTLENSTLRCDIEMAECLKNQVNQQDTVSVNCSNAVDQIHRKITRDSNAGQGFVVAVGYWIVRHVHQVKHTFNVDFTENEERQRQLCFRTGVIAIGTAGICAIIALLCVVMLCRWMRKSRNYAKLATVQSLPITVVKN